MIRYPNSFRCRPAHETLLLARQYAAKLGIVRVTDTTWLDRLGLPVYASIRPTALAGGLCVNSGKGFSTLEAEVGAYMEAIEFAMTEPNRSGLEIIWATPEEILNGSFNAHSILDLCPKLNAEIDPELPIECVRAIEVNTGQSYLVPAELVFYPFPDAPGRLKYFTSSTNGLSSGNSRTEAMIHGMLEVIERDILSFHFVQDNTKRVAIDQLPEFLDPTLQRLRKAEIELVIRYAPNAFGMPLFLAFTIDPAFQDPMFINAGYGCHTQKEIALSRAIAEAVQSRLVLIHGSRDDIPSSHQAYAGLSAEEKRAAFHQVAGSLREAGDLMSYKDINAYDYSGEDLEDYWQWLLKLVGSFGFDQVLTIPLSAPEDSLQVMRTIVPKMEFFNPKVNRLGVRLRDYAQQIAHQTVRRTEP